MRLIEEERRRWAASYEEKTVMIEQLQRELASTVEALQVERSFDGNRKEALDFSRPDGYKNKSDTRSGIRRSLDSTGSHNDGTGQSTIYEDRLHTLGNEVENLKLQLSAQKKTEDALRQKIDQQALELEHTKNAWRDSEGKLQFRNSQVVNDTTKLYTLPDYLVSYLHGVVYIAYIQIRQFEAEREARDRIEADLRAQVRQLEKARMARELDAKVQEACKEDASGMLRLQLAASHSKLAEMERKNDDLSYLVDTLSQERDRLLLLLRDRLNDSKQLEGHDWGRTTPNGHISLPVDDSRDSAIGPLEGRQRGGEEAQVWVMWMWM